MPQILHDSEGLKIKRNDKNSFIVVTLRYDADPSKRGSEWLREAQAGLTPEQFAQEYLIDYSAVLGSKVFPEISARRSEIVVAPFLEPKDIGRCWGGFDYGSRNPSSFHVYTVIDSTIYSIWELYEPCQNIPAFVEKMKTCPYWSKIRYIAADPSLWVPYQNQDIGPPIGIQDQFFKAGARNFIKGRNDGSAEDAWLALMRKHWQAEEPTFKIFNTCPEQIKEFETCIFSGQSERQLLTTVYKETIQDRNNHSLDDCKYFMLSNANLQQQPKTWESPIMVDRWSVSKSKLRKQAPVVVQNSGRKAIGGYI